MAFWTLDTGQYSMGDKMGSHELYWTKEMVSCFWDYEADHPGHYFAFQYGRNIARRLRPYPQGR